MEQVQVSKFELAKTNFANSFYGKKYVEKYGDRGFVEWLKTQNLLTLIGLPEDQYQYEHGKKLSEDDLDSYIKLSLVVNSDFNAEMTQTRVAYIERMYGAIPIESGILTQEYWEARLSSLRESLSGE